MMENAEYRSLPQFRSENEMFKPHNGESTLKMWWKKVTKEKEKDEKTNSEWFDD